VQRGENEKGRRVFEISKTAEDVYFGEFPDDEMSFVEEDLEHETGADGGGAAVQP